MGFTNTLYVTGFTREYKAKDISPDFEKYGPLVRLDCPPTRTPDGPPYAFVEFENLKDAETALELNDKPFSADENIRLRVEWAKSQPHPAGSGSIRGRGGYGRGGYGRRDYGPPRDFDRYGPPPRRDYGYRDRGYRRDYGPPDRGYGRDRDYGRDREYDRDREYGRDRDYGRERRERDTYIGRREGDDERRSYDSRGGDRREERRDDRGFERGRDENVDHAQERNFSRSRSPRRD